MIYLAVAVLILAGVGYYVYKQREDDKPAPVETKPPKQAAPKPQQPDHEAVAPVMEPDTRPVDSSGTPALWHGLKERPSDDLDGWEENRHVFVMLPDYIYLSWRNPETGEVQWTDMPRSARADLDYFHIATGAQDVSAPVWNALWRTTEDRNHDVWTGETGLQRIREYAGGLRGDPNLWPEPFRTAYMETH